MEDFILLSCKDNEAYIIAIASYSFSSCTGKEGGAECTL